MTYVREPVLQPVPIESLRPTQITFGMREVEHNSDENVPQSLFVQRE